MDPESIDSLNNITTLDGVDYSGLSDTGLSFSGSSTLQNTVVGAPLQLSTQYGPTTGTVIDTGFSQDPFLNESLTGASDTPIGSAVLSTPTPNVSPSNPDTANMLSGLAKFGASLGALFGNQPRTVTGATPARVTPGGVPVNAAYNAGQSGTMTAILVITVVALILLLAKGE